MDFKTFEELIKNTVVLTDEKKAYYLSKNNSYSPEIRSEMAKIIKEEEIDLERKIKLNGQKRQEETHERLKILEENEKKQIIRDQEMAENIINQI